MVRLEEGEVEKRERKCVGGFGGRNWEKWEEERAQKCEDKSGRRRGIGKMIDGEVGGKTGERVEKETDIVSWSAFQKI